MIKFSKKYFFNFYKQVLVLEKNQYLQKSKINLHKRKKLPMKIWSNYLFNV